MSAIAKTASITLLTGVPGNGKTLRAVWYMQQAVKAGESVFCCNLNGINIAEVIDFADPARWEDLPAGSILVVDEAQKFFRAAAGPAPKYIQAMEEIRHRGIRLILITQHPALIHANIRALVGLHEHLVRENGKQSAIVYRRSRVIDNVRSDKALAVEDHETWGYPKECFDLYKSAEVHTVKRTLPSKYKRAIIYALCAAALVGYCVWSIKSAVLHGSPSEPVTAAATRGAATVTGMGGVQAPRYTSARTEAQRLAELTGYADAHLPRFGMMPWTAMIYDERSVTADPALYCLSSMQGKDANGVWQDFSCTCLTEQGTLHELSQAQCRTIARKGPVYNPYKERREQAGAQQASPWGVGANSPYGAAVGHGGPSGSVIAGDVKRAGTSGEAAQPGTAP